MNYTVIKIRAYYQLLKRKRGIAPYKQKGVDCFAQSAPTGLAVLWNDRHFTVRIVASAFSFHIRMIAQRDVNDAAFTGWHGLQRLAPSALRDLICHALCHLDQLLLTAVTKPFHVHSELHELLSLFANDQRRNILKGGQSFRPSSDQHAQIIAANIHMDVASSVTFRRPVIRRDLRLEIEQMKHFGNDRLGMVQQWVMFKRSLGFFPRGSG